MAVLAPYLQIPVALLADIGYFQAPVALLVPYLQVPEVVLVEIGYF